MKGKTYLRFETGVVLDRSMREKILRAAQIHDFEHGGIFDAGCAAVNLWCSPEDKPACWDVPVTAGGLPAPRDFVATCSLNMESYAIPGGADRWTLSLEITPYEMLDAHPEGLPESTWADLEGWCAGSSCWSCCAWRRPHRWSRASDALGARSF